VQYFEKKEIVKDICMSYGFEYGRFINFARWNSEDKKIVRDFFEYELEMVFDLDGDYE